VCRSVSQRVAVSCSVLQLASYLCAYVFVCVCICVRMYLCAYVFVCVCICVRMCRSMCLRFLKQLRRCVAVCCSVLPCVAARSPFESVDVDV